MKDTTNKIKFSDVIENDEWRRQIQNFMWKFYVTLSC